MSKSQKKSTALNKKSQITRKPVKGVAKIAKNIAVKPEKSAGDSKQSMVLALLQRPAGATVDEMAKATGWQRDSVQGMMSGVLKKRLGLTVISDKEEHGRVYRITSGMSRL